MSTLYLRPNAAGDETNIAPQYPGTGAHWDKVDEETPDDLDSYVYTVSAEYQRDLYHLGDTPQTGTINWIKVWIRCMKAWGASYAKTAIKTGGEVFDGSEVTLGEWENYSTQYTTNPQAGGAWTWEQLNALQAGVSLKDISALGAFCTQVYVEIDCIVTASSSVAIGVLPQAVRGLSMSKAASVIVGALVSAIAPQRDIPRAASVIVGVAVSATRGLVTHIRSAAIAIGNSVLASRLATYTRTSSAIAGIVVSAIKPSKGYTKIAFVVLGIATFASRAVSYVRSASLAVGELVAALRGAVTYNRASQAAIGVVATATRGIATFIRQSASTVGIATSATRAVTFIRKALVVIGNVVSAIKSWTSRGEIDLYPSFKSILDLYPEFNSVLDLQIRIENEAA
jgi:hypothetical protein